MQKVYLTQMNFLPIDIYICLSIATDLNYTQSYSILYKIVK